MPTISPSNAAPAPGPQAAFRGVVTPWWPVPAMLLGWLVGAGLQLLQAQLWPVPVYGIGLGLALCALAWGLGVWWGQGRQGVAEQPLVPAPHVPSGRWHGRTLALFAAGVVAMGSLCGVRAHLYLQDALAPALEGQDIRAMVRVAAMPQFTEGATRLRLAVLSAKVAHPQGPPVQLPPQIDVSWYSPNSWNASALDAPASEPLPLLRAGELWEMTLRLKAPHGARNPHGFDLELWFWEQGVQAVGYVRAGPHDAPPVRLSASGWHHPVEQLRQHVRDAIVRTLREEADSPSATDSGVRARTAGVVAALVTGDQRAIDRMDWDVFRATGVAHLMSISGLHITLFAWIAAHLVQWLWRRSRRLCLALPAPTAALVAGVGLALAYALFSGWGVPAQRTVLMLATVAALRLSARQWPWPQVWLLACALVVLADPWALVQAGFWLSFVAVGILFATNPIANGPGKSSARGHFYALWREQWVVTLALTPLTLVLFGQFSVVGLLANLLAIPWVTLVVTPLALAGVVWAPLWSVAAWSLQPMVAGLQWLAQWPMAVFLPAAPLWAGLAAMAGGTLLALRLPWQFKPTALLLCLPLLAWQPARPPPGQFEILAPDIGQGNAVLVRTAQHTLLYDAGPRWSADSDAGHRVLLPLLRALGERLDVLMLSHRDSDHTGGAAAVLAQQPQARLMGSLEPAHPLNALRTLEPCQAGQRWQWDGVAFEVLHPPQALRHSGAPSNAQSCVLRITAPSEGAGRPGAVALLAGDIEAAQEKALVHAMADKGETLAADWLLVPHHGSKTSSSAEFLEAVQPRTALVQSGYRNRFGHPAPPVVQRYHDRGVLLRESARCGAAHWSSAAPADQGCERERNARYWQHRILPRAP